MITKLPLYMYDDHYSVYRLSERRGFSFHIYYGGDDIFSISVIFVVVVCRIEHAIIVVQVVVFEAQAQRSDDDDDNQN